MYKVIPHILLVLFFVGCNIYSKNLCEKTSLFDDNNKNDTGKVVFDDRVVFDTTANRIGGFIIDRTTKKPIANAWVVIGQKAKEFRVKTDNNGEFEFFKNNFSGIWQMIIRQAAYRCMIINGINISGGQTITIKLSPYFSN